jgi:hypothetical protein
LQGIDYNPLVDISVENKIYTVRSCYLKKVWNDLEQIRYLCTITYLHDSTFEIDYKR